MGVVRLERLFLRKGPYQGERSARQECDLPDRP